MAQPRVFVTSDTHFGHKKIIEFESSRTIFANIAAHDEELVARWNATVSPKDTVWHLGDAVFGAANLDLLARLNGHKHLVMGNHDQYPISEYAKYFNKIRGCVQLHNYILTHIPVHPSQFPRFKGNIHGHTHSKAVEDVRYIPVSLEHTGLRPVLLDKLISEHTKLLERKDNLWNTHSQAC